MKIPRKTKHYFIGATLAVYFLFSLLRFFENSSNVSDHNAVEDSLARTAVAQKAALKTVPNVVETHQATGPELLALRRVFMTEFMEKTAEARKNGDFLFAGQRVDPATAGKATLFATHDFETLGSVSAFMVQLRDNPSLVAIAAIGGGATESNRMDGPRSTKTYANYSSANAFQEIPPNSPNSVEGWGQVNVGGSLYKPGSGNFFVDRIFNGTLPSGQGGTLDVTVVNTNVPLRVT